MTIQHMTAASYFQKWYAAVYKKELAAMAIALSKEIKRFRKSAKVKEKWVIDVNPCITICAVVSKGGASK